MDASPYAPAALLTQVERDVVGMREAAEVLAVALATGRHVVLEGPPGTGKSTLLRSMADAAGVAMVFVEGNAELTPSRLVGYHDPALVIAGGYSPEAFVAGPLVEALADGKLLYIEEFNRVPEESLNVLITALAEGEVHIPRVGRIRAHASFRLVAAMNPFDAIGTARIGQAIYDRMCRIAIRYQDEAHERRIVAQVTGATVEDPDVELSVALVRSTRAHADIRVGSSVRGAIDMTLMAHGLRGVRAVGSGARAKAAVMYAVWLDAAFAGLSGRIRLDEACDRTPEEVIAELFERVLDDWQRAQRGGDDSESPNDDQRDTQDAGKDPAPARG